MLPYSFQRLICAYATVPTLLTLRRGSIFARAAEEALRSHNPLEVILLHSYPRRIIYDVSISASHHLTLAIVDTYKPFIQWKWVSDNPALTPDIIKKYKHQLYWDGEECANVNCNIALVGQGIHPLTQEEVFDLIDECQDKIQWMVISQYQTLTPAFIERYQDKVEWKAISRYQKLTLPMLEKYADKLNWTNIFLHNKSITPERMKLFFDRLDWDVMHDYEYITPQFIIDNHHRFTNWYDLSRVLSREVSGSYH